jgi:hypothetical protein
VAGLTNPQLSAAGQSHLSQQSPALVLHGRAFTLARSILISASMSGTSDKLWMSLLAVMDVYFCRSKYKNQPSMTDIDTGKLEYVAQKGAVRFGILAVDNRVRSNDQGNSSYSTHMMPQGCTSLDITHAPG